jgi:dipeptidyl aminopeptidase/acylaminoacyl peptidase
MNNLRLFLNLALLASLLAGRIACAQAASQLATPEEKHLGNVRQLTFGGSNAEAYFSQDGKRLIFQSTRDNLQCDQIFTMNVDGTEQKMVSTGKGRTTCSYIFPHNDKILYSSTHLADAACPPRPDYSKGYVWAVYPGFDIFTAKLGWVGLEAAYDDSRLRRGGHNFRRWQEDCFHLAAQWRSRYLLHGRERQACEAAYA